MAEPLDSLIAALQASDDLSGASVSGVLSQVVPPAVIVRPTEPWIEPDRFCAAAERYVAVATVSAATPEQGVNDLLVMVRAIMQAATNVTGWDYESVGAPIIDESTGTAFLVAPVRLIYRS